MALQFALNRLFLVTANLGSVFENSTVEDNWLSEFEKVVEQADPDLVALHCQEIGGKDFESCMPKVDEFVRRLRSLRCFSHFDRVQGWFDKEYDSDAFTALGSVYLFHKRVEAVYMWNFRTNSFHEVMGEEIVLGSMSENHFHRKEKFPAEYFPVVKWSRKGFLHTRWRMYGSHVINFVNIHLFHDEDNLVALEKSPSIYCGFRRKALEHTLQSVSSTLRTHEPTYIYGDFNFRLDFGAVVKHLTTTTNHHTQLTKSDHGMVDKVVYKNSDEEALVTVERKRFALRREDQFSHHFSELLQYDHEPRGFEELHELPVTFRPSYPFSEDTAKGNQYLDKRCPAWCDRILMNQQGVKLVQESPLGCMYNMMAKDTCVGDHKPIYLFFTIASTTPMRQIPDESLDA